MVYFIVLNILSLLDLTLTFYTLFLDKKKGCLDHTREKNLIVSFIFKKWGIGVNVFFFVAVYVQSIIVLAEQFIIQEVAFVMIGIFCAVNYYHLLNIESSVFWWEHDIYWDLKRLAIKLKKSVGG